MKVVATNSLQGCRLKTLSLALALSWSAACTGNIGNSLENEPGTGGPTTKPDGTPVKPGDKPVAPPPVGPNGVMPPPGVVNADVGRVAIHRLNNTEYDNTIRDLLGIASSARTGFIPDEKAGGFNNIASAFGMTAAQFEQYFNAAQLLADKAFEDTAARGKVVTCTPASATDQTCLKNIIKAFGARAYRRPLDTAEIDSLAKLATDAITAGEDFNGGVKQVVRTMLASVHFLYRIEVDPEPTSKTPRRLNGYELASRLSYLHWSSMPDAELFSLAANNDLLKDEVLTKQIDRLLADPKGSEFTANFATQWLGFDKFQTHQIEDTVFTTWDETLRASMLKEGQMYFNEFLNGSMKMDEFFTADINFVDAKLATFYGMPAGDATMKKVTHTTDERVGFLGLANYLTQTSFAYRTAPTLRGAWVMENLLCEHIGAPPNVPDLDDPKTPTTMTASQNVRERLAAHREMPACAGCHAILDPIGLGLENFDGIGRYRTAYPNGDKVDSSGELPGGIKFNGLPQLSKILGDAKDTRLVDCSVQKMMTYALSRELDLKDANTADTAYLKQVRDSWKTQGLSLKNLLKTVVLNDTFRLRRGEAL